MADTHEIHVWAADQVVAATKFLEKKNEELLHDYDVDLVALRQFIISASLAVQQIRIFGMLGQAYIKVVKGRKYIIFKGYAGLRPQINGVRYLTTNPKVSMFVVGTREIVKDAAKATKIAVFFYVGLDVIAEFQQDHFSLARLGIKVSSDVLKAMAAAAAGAVAGVILAVAGAPFVIAFAFVVGISLAVGMGLEWLDQKYHLTDRAVKRMMGYEAQIIADAKQIGSFINQTVDDADEVSRRAIRRVEGLDQQYHVTENITTSVRKFESSIKTGATRAGAYIKRTSRDAADSVERTAHEATVYLEDTYWQSLGELESMEDSLVTWLAR